MTSHLLRRTRQPPRSLLFSLNLLASLSLLFGMSLLLCACGGRIHYPPGGYAYPAHIEPGDSGYYYLPIRNLLLRKDSIVFADNRSFRAYDEPNLSLRYLGEDRFRLLYRAAEDAPVFITLTPEAIIVKTRQSGDEKRIPIGQVQFAWLVKLINDSGYWVLPYTMACQQVYVQDGDGFTLEANTPEKYNIVSRPGCAHAGLRLAKACQQLVIAAGLGDKIHLIHRYN